MTNYSNIAVQTTITGAIGTGDLTITVADATGYPTAPFRIVLDPGVVASEEVCQVTVKVGTLFTITRGYDGTTAKAHLSGATVIHAVVASDLTDLQTADTSEAGVRASADSALSSSIASEASTRASADTTLQSNITTEATARSAGDTTNANNLSTHAGLTTSAHGGIVASTDPRLTDARTPTAHASTHASAGSDPITIAESQVTSLVSDLAAKQPLDSDLTAIAALSTTAFGRALLTLADAAAGRTSFGLGTAATADTGTGAANVPTIAQADLRYQPLDSDLTAIAALSTTAYGRSLLTAADAAALRTLAGLGGLAVLSSITASLISDASANGRSLITATDYAAMRTLLSLVIGTNVQAWDADLDAIAALGSTGLAARTAANTWAQRALAGTTNQIDVTNGNGVSGNPTIGMSATYAGQASIVTLGTIGTGAWQGTKIGLTYGGTNADLSATGGAGNYLKQSSVGGAIAVGTIPLADIALSGLTAGQVWRATGATGAAFGALDLASANAVTGLLAPANGGTGVNNGSNLLTVPATGTAALLGTANVFTQAQTISHATAATVQVDSPAYAAYLWSAASVTRFEAYYDGGADYFGFYDDDHARDVWAVGSDGILVVGAPTTFSSALGNGLSLSLYRPAQVLTEYTATDPVAATNTYHGLASTISYGGSSSPVAAMGSVHAATFETIVTGSGSQSNEHAVLMGVLRYDTATTPGRAWFTDFNVHGAIAAQQSALNGITMFMNNYYNGSPSASDAAGMWIVTKAGGGGGTNAAHQAATTYPVDVGLGIAGVSSGGTLRGFTEAIRVGGAGSGWNIAASTIGTGLHIRDVQVAGIALDNAKAGSTPAGVTFGSGGQWDWFIDMNGASAPASGAIRAQGDVTISGGKLGVGSTSLSAVTRMHVLNAASAGGRNVHLQITQTTPNASDTSDSALALDYTLSANSATNELVTRVLAFSVINSLTGGGAISNLRAFNLAANTSASTTTSNLDMIFLEQGTTSGTVTTGRGLRLSSLQGTSQAGIAIAALSTGTNHTSVLLGTVTVPSGNWGIYASTTYDSVLAGKLGLGAVTAPTAILHVAANGTIGHLRMDGIAGNPASPAAGDHWYNTSQKSHRLQSTAGTAGLVGLLKAQTSIAGGDTINTTASETNFATNFALPANALTVGKVLRVYASGVYGTLGSGTVTLQLKVKAGTTTLLDSAAITTAISIAARMWRVEAIFTVIAVGASGTLECKGEFRIPTADTDVGFSAPAVGGDATVTVDTTASQTLQLSAQHGASSASNTIKMREFIVEVLD